MNEEMGRHAGNAVRQQVEIHSKIDYRRMLQASTESFKDFTRAIAELVQNSVDWGAQKVIIRFGKTGGVDWMSVIDDGEGFSDNGLSCAVSIFHSDARQDSKKKGRNGTATKALVHHCERFRLETKRTNTQLRTLDFTTTDLQEFLSKQRDPTSHLTEKPLPADHDIRTSGSVITWMGLYSKPASKRSPDYLVEHLSRSLTPQNAERVTVEIVGKAGSSRPLKPRELIGKRLRGSDMVEGVGQIAYDLSVASKPHGEEVVRVGAMGPVCSWNSFIDPIRKERHLGNMLGIGVLDHPHVMGEIDIPGWNKEYAKNARDGFDQALYALNEDGGDTLMAALAHIRRAIIPQVEKELGLTEGQVGNADHEDILDSIYDLILSRTGLPKRGKDQDELLWDLNYRRIALEPGDTMTLEIRNPTSGVRYVWDSSTSGGTLDAQTGTRVTFKAGAALGHFALMVREMGNPAHSLTVSVTVKDQLPFTISPPRHVIAVGNVCTLTLRNTRHTSGAFRWIGDDSGGGTLQVQPDGSTALFTAGPVLGTYGVRVEDRKHPDRFHASAQITICEEKHRNRHNHRREFSINGNIYELVTTLLGQSDALSSYVVTDQDWTTIKVNMLHPAAKFASRNLGAAMPLHILGEVAHCIADAELKSGNVRETRIRAMKILCMLLPKD